MAADRSRGAEPVRGAGAAADRRARRATGRGGAPGGVGVHRPHHDGRTTTAAPRRPHHDGRTTTAAPRRPGPAPRAAGRAFTERRGGYGGLAGPGAGSTPSGPTRP